MFFEEKRFFINLGGHNMSNRIGSEKDKEPQRPGNPDRRANAQGQDKGRDQQRNPNPNK